MNTQQSTRSPALQDALDMVDEFLTLSGGNYNDAGYVMSARHAMTRAVAELIAGGGYPTPEQHTAIRVVVRCGDARFGSQDAVLYPQALRHALELLT